MKGSTFTLTENQLCALVAQRVAEVLTPAAITELAVSSVRERIEVLTPAQAAELLQCADVQQCRRFCRKHGIPVVHGTHKKWWIRTSDVSAWILKNRVVLPGPGGLTGTRIERAA